MVFNCTVLSEQQCTVYYLFHVMSFSYIRLFCHVLFYFTSLLLLFFCELVTFNGLPTDTLLLTNQPSNVHPYPLFSALLLFYLPKLPPHPNPHLHPNPLLQPSPVMGPIRAQTVP
jgi:hypothetical protein